MSGTLHLAQALSNPGLRERKTAFETRTLGKQLVSQEVVLSFAQLFVYRDYLCSHDPFESMEKSHARLPICRLERRAHLPQGCTVGRVRLNYALPLCLPKARSPQAVAKMI
jgi:hypothetical protein